VAGLAGHFARSIFNFERAAQVPPPAGATLMDVIDYYIVAQPAAAESVVGRRIRELGDEEAADGPRALIDRFATSIAYLERRSVQGDLPAAVTLFRSPMSVDDCAVACLLELVVHADDLALSIRTKMPDYLDEALDLVVTSLARIGVRQRGAIPVLRAFTRRERAPESIAVF
jgi:Mycothiol maleylpyruvate isomerase N-terminal domain